MPRQPTTLNRRELSQAVTAAAKASTSEILGCEQFPLVGEAKRIGITGPPGAGKSTLIGSLIRRRLAKGFRIAVLAIDPSSPDRHGSILGDRLRMDELFDHPNLYIRSLPSRSNHDGLTENLPEILATLERFGFDEIIVETVGVGQAEYGVRAFVDTEVLVLVPDAGDHIQAMKSGILETADIYVVNKADLDGARKIAAEVRGVLTAAGRGRGERAVLLVRRGSEASLEKLEAAISTHLDGAVAERDVRALRRLRCRLRIESLIGRQVAELLCSREAAEFDLPLIDIYRRVLRDLVS